MTIHTGSVEATASGVSRANSGSRCGTATLREWFEGNRTMLLAAVDGTGG